MFALYIHDYYYFTFFSLQLCQLHNKEYHTYVRVTATEMPKQQFIYVYI